MRLRYTLGFLFGVLLLSASCDQGSKPAEKSTPPPNAAPTSSNLKETHPDQPTGLPQSGEGKQVPTKRREA